MTDQILVQVTEEDIRNGNPEDMKACAVALALRRAAEVPTAEVGFLYASTWVDYPAISGRIEYALPDSAADWIQSYINDYSVRPFEFFAEVKDI